MTLSYTKLDTPLNDFSLVCRGCLAKSGEMKNMREWGLCEDFRKMTSIKLTDKDDISELLCSACEDTLNKCKDFKIQCQNSNRILMDNSKKKLNEVDYQELLSNSTSSELYDNKLVIFISAPDMQAKIYLPCPYLTESQCREGFLKRKYLLAHLVDTHNVNGKYFDIQLRYHCSYKDCYYHITSEKNKCFSERKFLNQHYHKVHKSKDFKCNICSVKFSRKSDFDRHFKTCNMIFQCEFCDSKYKTQDRLTVHLMRNHPDIHKQYKKDRNKSKRTSETVVGTKKVKTDTDYICDSPKRSLATQTRPYEIINDVTLPSWAAKDETKTDEISTQTVFEDLLSLKSQTSEDESIFFSETVSLSDIQTQTFPLEFGLSRSNKETITSETQSPDLSIKETQTCYCLYDSPKFGFRLFDSVSSSPLSNNLTSAETQTAELEPKTDLLFGFNSAETQTCFDEELNGTDL